MVICRFGSSAMTAMTQPKFSSTLLARNATTANHTTLAQLPLQFFLNDQKMLATNMSSLVGAVKACTLKCALERGA